jgi:TonB-dependent SusC/RagA subfamily outer membrane receptor
MDSIFGAGPHTLRPLFLGTFALFFLAACATSRPAEDEEALEPMAMDVGYGTVMRGQIASVHGDDPYATRFRTVGEMLRRIPGVRVVEMKEGGMTVRIRGSSSLRGGEEPLWVLDGMVLHAAEEAIYSLNPSAIESITVLKNADATAIYGSRGANGVIVIKTRRR